MSSKLKDSFFELTADKILDAVEASLSGEMKNDRATGSILALNSLENRVHEIEFENGQRVVSKFYRPGRWTDKQLQEEHDFLAKLLSAEIPVVAPLELSPSSKVKLISETLGCTKEGIYFAVFPKVRGRLLDELSRVQTETLGRYLGRLHSIGKSWIARHRLRLSVEEWGEKSLDYLKSSPFLSGPMAAHYERAAESFLNLAHEKFQGISMGTIHGDCHLGNTLWQGEAPFFLDFDDMMVGPAVQDIWMVIRGRDEEALQSREILLSTYQQMCEFDRRELDLIEVLRGLRIIHYSAWIARRYDDPSFPSVFPDYGSLSYWRGEIEALDEILQLDGRYS